MPNINHSTLTDPYLHEPKGVASANAADVYVADGSGSGSWKDYVNYLSAVQPFDIVTPLSIPLTTSDAQLVFNATTLVSSNFTVDYSAGTYTRFKNTGGAGVFLATFNLSTKLSVGASHDVEYALFKNGTEIVGSRSIRNQKTDWGSVTVQGATALATNEYIDVRVKADGACTLVIANAAMNISGVITT